MASQDEQKILDIKVKYEDAIYGIIRYKEKIDELKASIKNLQQQEKDKTITTNEMKVQTEAINATIKEYQYNVRTLQKEIQNNVRIEQQEEGSLKRLRAELSNATKAYDELSKKEREGAKGQEMKKHIVEITNELKLAEAQTERYYRNVGNYYNSMLDLAEDLQHVVPMGGGGGVGEFTNSVVALGKGVEGAIPKIKALGATLLGLMTNPVFVALAGITGAGLAFKWFYDYNKGILEATRLTREFTGYTGDALESMRNSITATADAFGKDFKEVLSTADALMANYHLAGEEAMKVINDGFASGADLSGDMLSKIQQYAPTFHDAGIGASELVAILQQTRSGIFSDKGLDIIEMASKKIREMASGTASALDAIGISSKQVTEDLSDGTKSTFDIIQEVAAKMKSFGNDSKEVGDILKNVFGKQGAAAGLQLIEQLDTMSTDLEEVKKQTGAWGDVQQENVRLQKELNDYVSAVFDVSQKGFGSVLAQGKQLGTKVLIEIMKNLVKCINYFIDWYNESLILRGGINALIMQFKMMWSTVKFVANLIVDAFKGMGRSLKGVMDLLEGIVTFNFEKAASGFKQIFGNYKLTGSEILADAKKAGSEIAGAYTDGLRETLNGNLRKIELPKEVGGATSTDITGGKGRKSGTTSNGGKTTSKKGTTKGKTEEQLEAERQKKEEKALQESILKIKMQYNEKVLSAKKMYLAGMYESDKDYQTDLESLDKELITQQLEAYVAAGKIGEEKAQEMGEKLLDAMIKAKERMKQEAKELVSTYQKEFEKMNTNENLQRQLSGDFSEQGTEERLARYQAFLKRKMEDTSLSNDALLALTDEYNKAAEDREQAHADELRKIWEDTQNRAQSVAELFTDSMTSAFDSMFEDEKVSFKSFMRSILQTTLDAIEKQILAYETAILAKEIASKSWGGVASSAALIALITASFSAAKAAVKSFAVGGYVSGAGTGTSDSIPARLSNGESVMTAKATSMFSPILSAFNQLGGGVPIVVGGGQSQVGMDMLAAAVAKGYMMAPRPVVSVEEITSVQKRIESLERLAKV